MSVLVASFLISFAINWWALYRGHVYFPFAIDSDLSGVQKFHTVAVPRVGGIGLFSCILLALSVC